jgi:ABC-type transporter MlaC component
MLGEREASVNWKKSWAMLAMAASFTLAGQVASGDEAADAQAFIQKEHSRIITLMKENQSDAAINAALDAFVDYDEVTRRSFGEPCPPAAATCVDHYAKLTAAEKTEVRRLMRQLVQKNYRKALRKTLDYEIIYKGAKPDDFGDWRVRTEAQSKSQREPPVLADYLVHGSDGHMKLVGLVTEGSSLTKNYYDQFHKMFITPGEGYAYIVQKMKDKIAKPEKK